MKKSIPVFLLIFILIFSASSCAATKPFSDFTVGGGINSQITYVGESTIPEFERYDGYSMFFNTSIACFSFEFGLEKESYDYEYAGVKYGEFKSDITYFGINLPIKTPVGLSIIPGFRYGLKKDRIKINYFGTGSMSNNFYSAAIRMQIDILKGFGIYMDGSVKRFDGEDYGYVKLQGGLKYTFTRKS